MDLAQELRFSARIFYISWKRKWLLLSKYKSDTALSLVLEYILPLVMKITLLSVYVKYGTVDTTLRETLSYYMISNFFWGFFLADSQMTALVSKEIRSSSINYALIKPLPLLRYYYSATLSSALVGQIFGLMTTIIGIAVAQDFSNRNYPLLLLSIANAFLLCLSFNIAFCGLSLRITESKNISNSTLHFVEILRGEIFPLYAMPQIFQSIALALPPASMMYIPVALVLGRSVDTNQVLLGSVWAVLLYGLSLKYWKSSLAKFDGAPA